MPRIEVRSLIPAGLCALALFSDGLGWVFAIAGVVLLRRAAFSRPIKMLLAAIAVVPKLLFFGVRWLYAPEGVSFPIEPRNLATSPSLWVWSVLMAAFGTYLLIFARRTPPVSDAPIQAREGRRYLIAALGLVLIAGAGALLLGLTDGFHRIDDAGQGRWALRHAARGNVANFSAAELTSIEAAVRSSRSGRKYVVNVALVDGRSFSVTTGSDASLDELRKFAAIANIPGKVRIVRRAGDAWTSGASGFTAKDCVGTYDLENGTSGSSGTYEFWLDGERLAGKETVADSVGRQVRVLRNIKLSDTGELEFQPAPYVEGSQKERGGAMSFSFRWSTGGESGRFVPNGFEIGLQKYRKR
jgi:hypothetical protein